MAFPSNGVTESAYSALACESNSTLSRSGIGRGEGGGERSGGEDGLGLLTVDARPERRRETPRSISCTRKSRVALTRQSAGRRQWRQPFNLG